MDKNVGISLDKLPIKRLQAIEENGLERFSSDVGYEETTLSQIRRIDFAWAVKDSNKKQKTSSSEDTSSKPFPWQHMVENLRLAHQELSVIIDLINTVEVNDAVTVAGMTRPKQLPNEVLSDLAVSSATKLQCFRHLGKYFKQSAKSLEQKVDKEARFYSALIRLQQSWKVKRQRAASSGPGSEGFSIDLFDNSQYDNAFASRSSSISMLHVDRDNAGMLAICLPSGSCRSLHFGFLGEHFGHPPRHSYKISSDSSNDHVSGESIKEALTDNEEVRHTHAVLREAHQTIFDEQVFDLVNREAFNPSVGVNVTEISENRLHLNIGLGVTVFVSLVPSEQDHQTTGGESTDNSVTTNSPSHAFDGVMLGNGKQDNLEQDPVLPDHICYEIYLRQLFSDHVFANAKDGSVLNKSSRLSSHPVKDKSGPLGHFCMSLVHRIFSKKVLMVIESLVHRVPYLHLISHSTWHSRISSWSLFMKVPQSILHASCETKVPNDHPNKTKSQFWTKVVVKDDYISVEGECAPDTIGLFRRNSVGNCHMNRYDCDLVGLPMILLQQFASQVVGWLYEEAIKVGLKARWDFLCLCFELDGGESLSLVAHVDPEDCVNCISWWLVMEDGLAKKGNAGADVFEKDSKFLGHLSLDVLYSTLMDLVRLSNGCENA